MAYSPIIGWYVMRSLSRDSAQEEGYLAADTLEYTTENGEPQPLSEHFTSAAELASVLRYLQRLGHGQRSKENWPNTGTVALEDCLRADPGLYIAPCRADGS